MNDIGISTGIERLILNFVLVGGVKVNGFNEIMYSFYWGLLEFLS